jgi:hypothetical protein
MVAMSGITAQPAFRSFAALHPAIEVSGPPLNDPILKSQRCNSDRVSEEGKEYTLQLLQVLRPVVQPYSFDDRGIGNS